MTKWVEIKRYEKGNYRLLSRRGDVCIAPLSRITSDCDISRQELRGLIEKAIKQGEISRSDPIFDALF